MATPTPQIDTNNEELRKIVEDAVRHARMNAVMVERYDNKVAEDNILLNVETIMAAVEYRDQQIALAAQEKWKSLCGCPMCEHHSTAYALHAKKKSAQEKS